MGDAALFFSWSSLFRRVLLNSKIPKSCLGQFKWLKILKIIINLKNRLLLYRDKSFSSLRISWVHSFLPFCKKNSQTCQTCPAKPSRYYQNACMHGTRNNNCIIRLPKIKLASCRKAFFHMGAATFNDQLEVYLLWTILKLNYLVIFFHPKYFLLLMLT